MLILPFMLGRNSCAHDKMSVKDVPVYPIIVKYYEQEIKIYKTHTHTKFRSYLKTVCTRFTRQIILNNKFFCLPSQSHVYKKKGELISLPLSSVLHAGSQ